MLFDEILENLELTHKPKPSAQKTNRNAPSVNYRSQQDTNAASIEDLDEAVRNKYEKYLSAPNRHLQRGKLANGDDSDHESDTSTADFAFACDLLQDGFKPDDVEIIMRATRYREKFDEMRGDTTYLERTITQAIMSVSEGSYTPPTLLPILSLERGRICIPLTPPPPRDYVWQGRMVAGHAYALGGFGGVSKSQAALQLAASIALGIQFGGVATKKGSVLLIFGEDDVSEITRRLGAYAAQGKFS